MGENAITCVTEKSDAGKTAFSLQIVVVNQTLLLWTAFIVIESWMSSMRCGLMVHSESRRTDEVLLLRKTAARQTTSFTSAAFTQRQHGVYKVFLFARRSVSSSAEWETWSGHFKIVLRLLGLENGQSGLHSVSLMVICEPPKHPPLWLTMITSLLSCFSTLVWSTASGSTSADTPAQCSSWTETDARDSLHSCPGLDALCLMSPSARTWLGWLIAAD